jgi:hypothetical protein
MLRRQHNIAALHGEIPRIVIWIVIRMAIDQKPKINVLAIYNFEL